MLEMTSSSAEIRDATW
jgi:hypothetical protein